MADEAATTTVVVHTEQEATVALQITNMDDAVQPGAQSDDAEPTVSQPDSAHTSSGPDLGRSILNRSTTRPSSSPSASVGSSEDYLDILRNAQAQLVLQGEMEPVIKQELTDKRSLHDVPFGPSIHIDLTGVDDPIEISDDENSTVQVRPDKLPLPHKRGSEAVGDESNVESSSDSDQFVRKRPRTKAPTTRKPPKKKGVKGKGGGKKIAMTNNAATVSDLTSSSLFSELARLSDVPELPDIGRDALRNNTEGQELLFAALPPGANREAAANDARMLNRACNIFGPGIITNAGSGEFAVKGMASTLRPHQVLGTAFMIQREKEAQGRAKKGQEQPCGGILADQMGLGKTVMSLALVVRGKWRDPSGPPVATGGRTTLIVANNALVLQWLNEIAIHCNTGDARSGIGNYKIYRSRDEMRANAIKELATQEILLTTYEEVAKSYPLQDPPPEIVDHDERQAWWEDHFDKFKGHLHSMNFKRIILDEAHLIRNPATRKSRACRALTSKYRWALTGTPMSNGVFDLHVLLDFIKVPKLEPYATFKTKYYSKSDHHTDKEMNTLLAKCMLRRSHADKLFESRLVTLPDAHQTRVVVHFNPVEREVYEIIKAAFARRFNQLTLVNNMVYRSASILALITRLRQLTAHPLMLQSTMLDLLDRSDLIKLGKAVKEYGSLEPQGEVMMKRIKKLLTRSYKQKESEKQTVDTERDAHLVPDTTSDENISTGRRYGINFRFSKYVDSLEKATKRRELDAIRVCHYCMKEASEPRVTSCLHVYCTACLEDMAHEAAEQGLSSATCQVDGCGTVYGFTEECDETFARLIAMKKNGKTATGKPKKKKLPDDIKDWIEGGGDIVASAKTTAVKAQVISWMENFPDSKIIIYTQFTAMIHILENMCKIERWKCCKYFGEMGHDARQKTIEQFQVDDNIRIMICSLKCGGLGLNLTMASKVICIDPWYVHPSFTFTLTSSLASALTSALTLTLTSSLTTRALTFTGGTMPLRNRRLLAASASNRHKRHIFYSSRSQTRLMSTWKK